MSVADRSDVALIDSEEAARRLMEAFPEDAREELYHRALDASDICALLGRQAYAELMREAAARIRRLALH